MTSIYVALIPLFALFAATTAVAQNSPSFRVYPTFVPGLGHAHCGSKDNSKPDKCMSTAYTIQVVAIYDKNGTIGGCAAFFPYNSLTIHTTSAGETTTVTWQVNASSPYAPAGWTVAFKSPGIKFANGNGGKDDSPFAASSNVNSSASTVTMKLDDKLTSTQSFGHYPVVTAGPSAGKQMDCAAGDPVIVNSAD